jgi:HSP20 family molecular chaperone IbpA
MRFSFLAPLFFALLTVGCSYPFSFDVSSDVTLPLGAAANCADAIDGVVHGTFPADGEPDKHGNLTSFTHTFSSTDNRCTLRAEWRGPLVDMDELRDDAAIEMRALGLDPDDVDVSITSIEPRVTAVRLRGPEDAEDAEDAEVVRAGVTYRASVGVPGDADVITLAAGEGDDLAHPDVTVAEQQSHFLRAANEAWRERAQLPGVAAVDIDIDLAAAASAQGDVALPAALRVDFDVVLEGDAAL